eukprot:IDg10016t1
MSRFGDYETAAPRRRGGYGAYNDGDDGEEPRRGTRRDDPYTSVRPLPPKISASSVYDTFRPPNLHGNESSRSDNDRRGGRQHRDREEPRRDRDEYSRRDPYRGGAPRPPATRA